MMTVVVVVVDDNACIVCHFIESLFYQVVCNEKEGSYQWHSLYILNILH